NQQTTDQTTHRLSSVGGVAVDQCLGGRRECAARFVVGSRDLHCSSRDRSGLCCSRRPLVISSLLHEPRSRRRQSAHLFSSEEQHRLTAAHTVQGFNARSIAYSLPASGPISFLKSRRSFAAEVRIDKPKIDRIE